MYHKLLPVLAGAFWFCLAPPAVAAEGTVIWKNQGCAHFVLQTGRGYGLYEWTSGAPPNDSDIIEGDVDSAGAQQLHNRTADLPVTVFVVAVGAHRADVEKKIPARCR